MMRKDKFGALAATTKTGRPTARQIADNAGMDDMPQGKYKSTMHEYDANRPKRQVMSRKSK